MLHYNNSATACPMPPTTPHPVRTSARLDDVRYEIRGELAQRALELEAQGREIIKLNIGNPGLFGFSVPEHVRAAIERNLARSEAYCHQKGLESARATIAMQQRAHGVGNAVPENIFIGNGVSELIDLALRALLNDGDEVLLPSPDYPLWSAATSLNGGHPRLLPLSRARQPSARPGRDRGTDHTADARAGRDQPEQSHRCGLSARPA